MVGDQLTYPPQFPWRTPKRHKIKLQGRSFPTDCIAAVDRGLKGFRLLAAPAGCSRSRAFSRKNRLLSGAARSVDEPPVCRSRRRSLGHRLVIAREDILG